MGCDVLSKARNDKALNNQGFIGTNMAEAMGFEPSYSQNFAAFRRRS